MILTLFYVLVESIFFLRLNRKKTPLFRVLFLGVEEPNLHLKTHRSFSVLSDRCSERVPIFVLSD